MPYVVLDGPDGCGKSVQAERLCAWLGRGGHRALHLREPGSTPVGEALRALLLDPATGDMGPVAETLLFTAARAEMVARIVRPALAEGTVVVVERCFLSTMVYQGLSYGEHPGVDREWILELTRRAHGDCMPDRVWLLDVPSDVAAVRRESRNADRIEERGEGFQERVREAYLNVAQELPEVEVLDASAPLDEVHDELRRRCAALIGDGVSGDTP